MDWTKCSYVMPKQGKKVMLVYHGVVQYIAYTLEDKMWEAFDDSDGMPLSFASHWAYWPEPPKEGAL